ncbi:MAG: hypothetical protein IT436_08255 [Phycisphaerales bacterium]|nr:hypothetical protein [Phycisphaerales bacterium]
MKPAARTIVPTLAVLAGVLFALGGCRIGGNREVEKVNDELRRENLELKQQVEMLSHDRDDLRVKLEGEARARLGALNPEVLAALPVCAGVEIEKLSGLEPADRSAAATGVVVYLRPYDSRDRVVQIVGMLDVEAAWLPGSAGKGEAPRTIARARLEPAQLREAYRSGLMGSGYTVELPLETPIGDRAGTLVIRAEFADALTGKVWKAERTETR